MKKDANSDNVINVTRRDFLRGAAYAGLAAAVGMPIDFSWATEDIALTKVVLIRDEFALNDEGNINAEIIKQMLDQAVSVLLGKEEPIDAWKELVDPEDIVGIKSNEWGPLPTPIEVENAIETGLIDAGVDSNNIGIDDRGVLQNEIFLESTALINVRPLRTHHWSGVGSLIKNYIMFVPEPSEYHDNSCADLALIWKKPMVKGKTRLNILVLLQPLFHGVGRHHFDKRYTWDYNGLLIGTDPVAVDAVGLKIFEAQRKEFFGEDRPLKPPAHHIAYADIRHHLGTSDLNKIQLVRLGWQENVLI